MKLPQIITSTDLSLAWSGRWGLPPGLINCPQAPCDGFCGSDSLPWWCWGAGGEDAAAQGVMLLFLSLCRLK